MVESKSGAYRRRFCGEHYLFCECDARVNGFLEIWVWVVVDIYFCITIGRDIVTNELCVDTARFAITADVHTCGWCKDRWGFSWQITPRVLLELTTSTDREQAKRAFEVMMTMGKIDIAALEATRKSPKP